MTNRDKREIMQEMRDLGFFEYGAVVDVQRYRDMFGIVYPATGTRDDFTKVELEELGAVDFIRNQLLNEGKYLKKDNSCYRILLPSENQKQVLKYNEIADSKLKRAIKLAKNTPQEYYKDNISDLNRLTLKRLNNEQKKN